MMILTSTISTGCPKQPSESPPAAAVCRRWNRQQLTGYFALVQIAKQERALGDEVHIAEAVEAMGALLKRCGILTPDA